MNESSAKNDKSNKRRPISRFRIQSRVTTLPSSHKQPQFNYFSTIKANNNLLQTDQFSINFNSRLKQINHRQHRDINNFQQNKTKTRSYFNTKDDFYKNKIQESKNNLENSKRQKTQRSRAITQANLHFNYLQYESLIDRVNIDSSLFDKIANKNDKKHDNIIQITQTVAKYVLKMQKSNQTHKIKKPITNRVKTKLQNNNPKTIAGTKLGADSLDPIRMKLEQKWAIQQKQALQKNEEEISQSQDEQTRKTSEYATPFMRATLRKHAFQNKDQQEQKIKQLNIDKISNIKYKQSLRIIFEKRKNVRLDPNTYDQNEYLNKQQNLLNFNQVYNPKKDILNHKVDWRV